MLNINKKRYSYKELEGIIQADILYPKEHKQLRKEMDAFFINKGFTYENYGFDEEMLDNIVPIEYWYYACDVAINLASQIIELKESKFDDLYGSLDDIEREIKFLRKKLKQKIK